MTEQMLFNILLVVAIIVLGIVALAVIGTREQRKEREFSEQYNRTSLKSFMKGQKNKKLSRQNTPKAKSTNK